MGRVCSYELRHGAWACVFDQLRLSLDIAERLSFLSRERKETAKKKGRSCGVDANGEGWLLSSSLLRLYGRADVRTHTYIYIYILT
jgi:hypothetical protein